MAATLLRISRGAQRLFFSRKPSVLHRAVHTSVWWDMNSVQVPESWDYSSVAGNITDALNKLGHSAPVAFYAYGMLDYFLTSEQSHALSSTGIQLTDVFITIGKHEHLSSKGIANDIWLWTMDHPAPANCLLITGDLELSFAIHQLAMQRYNILLARTRDLGDMEAAAKTLWRWKSLLAGYPPERTI